METASPADTPTDKFMETASPADTPTDKFMETASPGDPPTDKFMETASPADPPTDKYRLVYLTFYCFGVVTLLPWNMFATAAAYWNIKFRTVLIEGDNLTMVGGVPPTCQEPCLNDLQISWGAYLAIANMVPFVIILTLNGMFGHHFKALPRLIASLLLNILAFIFTTVMVKIDTDGWQSTFLYVTLASVSFIMVNSAIFEGGIFGLAGRFPSSYMGAVFSGQAIGGVLVSGVNVLILGLGATAGNAAFSCFLTSILFLISALASFLAVTRTAFYKYHIGDKITPDNLKLLEKETSPSPQVIISPLRILRQIFPYAFSVFLVFLITLSAFPALTMLVVSTADPETLWASKFYVPVSCFLLFNLGDYLGRLLASWVPWSCGPRSTLSLSILRLVLLPLLLLCNIQPSHRHVTTVLFQSDVVYSVFMALFSLSNGYVGSICMQRAPQVLLPLLLLLLLPCPPPGCPARGGRVCCFPDGCCPRSRPGGRRSL